MNSLVLGTEQIFTCILVVQDWDLSYCHTPHHTDPKTPAACDIKRLLWGIRIDSIWFAFQFDPQSKRNSTTPIESHKNE